MPAFSQFRAYSGEDVIQALRKLFHGKCAYCERAIEKGTREVEHYRPKGGVGETNHPGYWWLAHSWTNLLPTCGPCNKRLKQHVVTADMTVDDVEKLQSVPAKALAGKANNFPVGAARLIAKSEDHVAEKPQLIDPTRDDPDNHLRWHHSSEYSIVIPASVAGTLSTEAEATIRHLGLNRVGLVEARTKQLNILKLQRIRILEDLDEAAQDPTAAAIYVANAKKRAADMNAHCAADADFSAMSCAFVATFREELAAWLRQNASALIHGWTN